VTCAIATACMRSLTKLFECVFLFSLHCLPRPVTISPPRADSHLSYSTSATFSRRKAPLTGSSDSLASSHPLPFSPILRSDLLSVLQRVPPVPPFSPLSSRSLLSNPSSPPVLRARQSPGLLVLSSSQSSSAVSSPPTTPRRRATTTRRVSRRQLFTSWRGETRSFVPRVRSLSSPSISLLPKKLTPSFLQSAPSLSLTPSSRHEWSGIPEVGRRSPFLLDFPSTQADIYCSLQVISPRRRAPGAASSSRTYRHSRADKGGRTSRSCRRRR
jgi:hypothetical protein